MKKAVIVALVCINVALLASLMLGQGATPAKAQADRNTKYLMAFGSVAQNDEAVYIVDLNRRVLGAWRYDTGSKKMVEYVARHLDTDFTDK